MSSKFIIGFLVFLCDIIAYAQDPAVFTASVDEAEVAAGETFTVTFTLENGTTEEFGIPSFGGLEVISGPSQSFRSYSLNGNRTSSIGFSYILLAPQEGTYTIGPATIWNDGKQMKTNPIIIRVKKGASNQGLNEQEADTSLPFFVRLETDTTAVYTGQLVMLNYNVYTRTDLRTLDFHRESDYGDAFVQIVRMGRDRGSRVEINGVSYIKKTFRKIALFPVQAGTLHITPATVTISIAGRNNRSPFGSLFSSFSTPPVYKRTNDLTLQVKSPPPGPASFSGATGNFNAFFRITPVVLSAGQALDLVLQIEGQGDVKQIMPPTIELIDGFEVYPPSIRSERMVEAGGTIRGEKTFVYSVVAHQPGDFTLTPSFTWFDVDDKEYQTSMDTFEVTVRPGTMVSTKKGTTTPKARNFVPTMPLTKIENRHEVFTPVFLVMSAIPLVGLLIVFIIPFAKKRFWDENGVDVQIKNREVAIVRMKEAMEKQEHLEFYEQVGYILKNLFLSHTPNVAYSKLDANTMIEWLERWGAPDHIIQAVEKINASINHSLYAGIPAKTKMDEVAQMLLDVVRWFDNARPGSGAK